LKLAHTGDLGIADVGMFSLKVSPSTVTSGFRRIVPASRRPVLPGSTQQ
jgi:hypothetical protein